MSSPAAIHQPSQLSQWDHSSGVGRQSVEEEDEGLEYPGGTGQELTAPPDFRPFYTLIEDALTGEYHHPHVHYVFADDDPELVTSSIVNSVHGRQSDDVRQRLILLDIGRDGKSIKSAHSLSPDWQLSQATITQAPSWNEATQEKARGGLMLRIDGAECHGQSKEKDVGSPYATDAVVRMEAIMGEYVGKLDYLQSLLDRRYCHSENTLQES